MDRKGTEAEEMTWMNNSTVEELRKTRKALDIGALWLAGLFIVFLGIGLFTWMLTSWVIIPISSLILSIIMAILFTLYVLKRDIWSIAILLKEMKP